MFYFKVDILNLNFIVEVKDFKILLILI